MAEPSVAHRNAQLLLSNINKISTLRQIYLAFRNIKFNDNPFSGSYLQTDKTAKLINTYFQFFPDSSKDEEN
jgi:hypothetical protein